MIVQKAWICFVFVLSSAVYASDSPLYDDSLPISKKDWYREKKALAAMNVCYLMNQDHFSVVHNYGGVTHFFEQWRHSISPDEPEVDSVQQKAIIVCSVIQGLNIPLQTSPKIDVAFTIWKKASKNLYIIELADAHEKKLQRAESL
jgi:hypothetical protein